ncbi:MAG: hypothetical protein OEM49_07690 [Myxococcales bacterium]|nr:hypothetical protein [Myxococcales bacterium]MDH5306794.1 hypothetical protein [Myxococcales bacterium]MDH5565942.1 hypothetical protein [Myxococcales bacterium]
MTRESIHREVTIQTMGKAYSSDELARRAFLVSMAGVGAFIAVVFLFIIL